MKQEYTNLIYTKSKSQCIKNRDSQQKDAHYLTIGEIKLT